MLAFCVTVLFPDTDTTSSFHFRVCSQSENAHRFMNDSAPISKDSFSNKFNSKPIDTELQSQDRFYILYLCILESIKIYNVVSKIGFTPTHNSCLT